MSVFIFFALLAASLAAGAEPTQICRAGWTPITPTDLDEATSLWGVAADDTGSALVVGLETHDPPAASPDALVSARWDPAEGWAPTIRVPLPPLQPGVERRDANDATVAATGPDDAWFLWNEATQLVDVSVSEEAHVAHWDGTGWTQFPLPTQGMVFHGAGVAVGADGAAWIVVNPYDPVRDHSRAGILLRWSGSAWARVERLPDLGTRTLLDDVAVADDAVWISSINKDSLFRRSDGRWRVFDVSGISPRDLNVTGVAGSSGGLVMTVTEGGRWSHGMAFLRGPHGWERLGAGLPSAYGYLSDAQARAPSNLWAWGTNDAFMFDGRSWTNVDPPMHRAARYSGAPLEQIAPVRDGAFAVGYDGHGPAVYRICAWPDDNRAGDRAILSARATSPAILARAPLGSAGDRIRDGSPLALFDSGELGAGDRFLARYPGAGRYPLMTRTGPSPRVTIPVTLWWAPHLGTVLVSWAPPSFQPLGPPPWRWDVEVRGPDDAAFRPWLSATDEVSLFFEPDQGTGVYVVRARSIDDRTGLASDWSPPRTIEVP
jgi:hypothetical protein